MYRNELENNQLLKQSIHSVLRNEEKKCGKKK